MAIVRVVGGVMLAIASAVLLLAAVEGYSALVHPFPAGFGGTNDEVCAHVARYPAWVLATVIPMWAAIVSACTWIARRVGRSRATSWAVAALLLIALGANLVMLPYPAWFRAGTFACLVAGAILGGRMWCRT